MKFRLLGVLLLGLVLQVSTAAAATEDAPRDHNALRKLGRGIANVLFGVVEVPNQCTKAVSDHGGAGMAYGLPKGFVRWICREFVGVYEVVTFAVPVPKGYKPVMKPEFPNEDYEP
jgi:putative exosortase-associated protein (TIGR04073 family)